MIGDSHSLIFNKISLCSVVHHIGAATAYNLKTTDSSTRSYESLFTILSKRRKDDIFILVFGEIDCRIHIYNQYKKHNEQIPVGDFIEKTIDNYNVVLNRIKLMQINFIVCSTPPTGNQDNIYGYPYYASTETRAVITRQFNQMLQELCISAGYRYLDLYTVFSDDNGVIREGYCDDGVHLNNHAISDIRSQLKNTAGIRVNRFSIDDLS